MKSILVCGIGLFGKNLVKTLHDLHHDVMAVDIREERINTVLPLVTDARIGDCTDQRFMEELDIRDYDVCFVTIGDHFQSSVETTLRLKELGAKFVVARAANESHEKILRNVGADEIIYPERQLAVWSAVRYSTDHIFDYMALDDETAMAEVTVPAAWAGKTIGQLDIRRRYQLNMLGWKQDKKLHVDITPDTVLKPDVTLLLLGKIKHIQKCFRNG